MKNRGYTLLELLGVIVILALLTTLVFPSVLNAIKKSSDKTDELSMDLISNAADIYINDHVNEFIKFNGNKYVIELETLIDKGNLPSNIKISDIDNINDKCIQVTYQDDFKYELKNKESCKKLIQFDSICKSMGDQPYSDEPYSVGHKYECRVDPNMDVYTFYVLSYSDVNDNIIWDKTNAKSINLIMDRNINSDGTPTTKAISKIDKNNRGIYNEIEWISQEDYELAGGENWTSHTDINTFGPITAMNFLTEATKNWTNINEMTIDPFNNGYGYSFNSKSYNTHARMPHNYEVSDSNEKNEYLYENLDGSDWVGEGSQPTNNISDIYGYWTFSTHYFGNDLVWDVLYDGTVWYADLTSYDGGFGVRPVINLQL